MTKPVIFGISGTKLTDDEIKLFKENEALGFILFARNIETKNQLKDLTKSLKNLYPERETLIFIDQEGGRVARIKPPIANKLFPSAEHFSSIYTDSKIQAKIQLKANYVDLMNELKEFGIDSPCAPVCDLKYKGADDIIGDRSFGSEPEQVIDLCKSAIAGISRAQGIPFIKHIPGHGRANVDSHFDLPIIDTTLEELESSDFAVFASLSQENVWAMTAHIVYTALDPQKPVTLSEKAIKYIRKNIGFKGKLVSDDLCMYALHGDIGQKHTILKRIINSASDGGQWKEKFTKEAEKILGLKTDGIGNQLIIEHCNKKLEDIKPYFLESLENVTRMTLEAGCDIVLHCSGDLDEMKAVCKAL